MKKALYISFSLKNSISVVMVCCIFLALVFFLNYRSVTTVFSESASCRHTIIVDAGHGGEDSGTSSEDGVREKDINLAISFKTGNILRLLGFNAVYTRVDDTLHYDDNALTQRQKKNSDLQYRLKLINSYPDELFLSIHQNYFTESKYSGAQVFYSGNNPLSRAAAEIIQSSIKEKVQPENYREIKKSGSEIYLLNNAVYPAVMVECGFMSNKAEALLLSDEVYQKKISLAIAAGVADYYSQTGKEE